MAKRRFKKSKDRYESGRDWQKRRLVSSWRGMTVERPFPPAKAAGDLASEVLRSLNLEDRLNLEEVQQQWADAIGEPFASGSRPVALRHGTLHVATTHPTLHYSILGMEPQLLAKLQSHFGADKIKGLRFQHG